MHFAAKICSKVSIARSIGSVPLNGQGGDGCPHRRGLFSFIAMLAFNLLSCNDEPWVIRPSRNDFADTTTGRGSIPIDGRSYYPAQDTALSGINLAWIAVIPISSQFSQLPRFS